MKKKRIVLNIMEISNAENINHVKSILKKAHRVLVLTGAGISAESGVPTFRGGGGAPVWRGMPFEQLSSAEMVEKDLPLVWEWFDYRRGLIGKCEPNAAHQTLAEVQESERFEELVNVTQNIDGLHQAAGAKSVIELHGSIWQARCFSCKTKQDLRDIPKDERPPVCPECFDSMRPDVILFGEAMPMQAVYVAQEKARTCDVCIVVGTSALVYPAAELPLIAKQNGAKIIEINPEETQMSAQADVSLRGKAAEILPLIFAEDNSPNSRLHDNELFKLASEQTREEEQAENAEAQETPQNNQQSKGSFMTSESHPLRVDFVTSEEFPVLKRLGLTFAPGKKQFGAISGNWDRDLTLDLARLREIYKTDTLVSLVEERELSELGISNFEHECAVQGIELIRFPLRDVSVPPSLENFARLVQEIIKRLKQKKTVVIHCKGGRGRAGLTAACAIVAAGGNEMSAADAIKMVRAARSGAVETVEQENFVSEFGEYRQLRQRQRKNISERQKMAQEEKVLSIAWEGGGKHLLRLKTDDGKWYFFAGGSNMAFDEDDIDTTVSWQSEPVESINEAIKDFINDYQVFFVVPTFVHPEYRREVKAHLENLYANLTADEKKRLRAAGDFARNPSEWMREADWRMERSAKRKDNMAKAKSGKKPVAKFLPKSQVKWTKEELKQLKATGVVKAKSPAKKNAGKFEKKSGINWAGERDPSLTTPNEQSSDKHFLLCWKEQSVLNAKNSPHPLDVVSSRQLNRVNAGDTIWIVTVNQDGELILAGRLKAAEVVDYPTAVRRLHDANLWDGDYYALAKEDTAEKINLINLRERALELRFKNSGSDRLTITNGKVRAQQLGSMRELTAESAQMLTEIWENAAFDFGDKDFDDEDFDGEAFSDDDSDNDDYNFPDAVDVEIFEDIARREPLNAEAHYNVGVVRGQTGDLEGARQAYRRAVELDPNYFAAWYNLGADHLDAGEWREGVECFDKAIAAKPDFAIAHFMKGAAYDRLDNHEEAIRSTRKGLEFSPDDAQAYHNIGYSYQRLGEYEKASESFEKALQLAPDDDQTFYKLGKCYRELGEREKEFDAYRKAIEIAPDFIDALFALGTVYAHLTETAEGERVTYFETGGGKLELKYVRLFYYYTGLANLALGNLDEARESQADLRKTDDGLAKELQFFIDRFQTGNKKVIKNRENTNQNSIESDSRQRKTFKVRINENVIEAKSIPELYRQVLMFLTNTGLLENASLPFATSPTRYLIAREPVHPSGKSFFKHVEYAGFYMETNKNRIDAIKHLEIFVKSLRVEFENLEDEDSITIAVQLDKKQIAQPTVEQRFLGSLLGLAVGDALGTTVEFKPTGTFPRITTITGGGPFGLNVGEWTDDTSMALCLADSLIESGGFDPVDQMLRYCRWKNEGYLSSNGIAFDIGNTVRRALEKFEQQANNDELTAYCGSVSPSTAGNGSLMRLAPVPLFFANEPEKAVKYAGESSRTTHGARECVDACRYFAALIIGVIQGKSKEEILSQHFTSLPGLWKEEPLAAKAAEIAAGSFKSSRPPQISGSIQGYIIPSLHAALWAFYHTDDFAEGALKVVNLGYDADTYGAIYGQLAGAYYGAQSIPEEWLNLIAKRDLIESLARRLYESSGG